MENLLKQGEQKSIQRIVICKLASIIKYFKLIVFQSNEKISKPQFVFAALD